MNETRLEKTYANNRLKRFKIKDTENSSTRQIEIREMLNITFENSIDAMENSNIVNKNVRIIDKSRNKVARDAAESLNTDDQIFKNITANDNLLNSKTRNVHATDKFNVRRSNRLTEIENSLIKIDREKNTAAFAAINETSIEKK